jgi:hypothetical protein
MGGSMSSQDPNNPEQTNQEEQRTHSQKIKDNAQSGSISSNNPNNPKKEDQGENEQRTHSQEIKDNTQIDAAINGDFTGDLDQSTGKTTININYALQFILNGESLTKDDSTLSRAQQADELGVFLREQQIPIEFMQQAIQQLLPLDSNGVKDIPSIIEKIKLIFTKEEPDKIFVRTLLENPKLPESLRIELSQRLGEQVEINHSQAAILFIGVEPAPHTDNMYSIKAWLWPNHQCIWPLNDDEFEQIYITDIPNTLARLHEDIAHIIAPYGDDLEIELFLPAILLVEPSHAWTYRYAIDPEDENDVIEQAFYIRYSVVVRSVTRALSPHRSMVSARERWKRLWKLLVNNTSIGWTRPCDIKDEQLPPFFCPVQSEQLDGELHTVFEARDYVCFVESVIPPQNIDLVKSIVKRVISAGLPAGLWFAHNQPRTEQIYHIFDELLQPQFLPNLPKKVREIERQRSITRPIIFFDNPERIPFEPNKQHFTTPNSN